MKLNLDAKVLDIKNVPLKDGQDEMTLSSVVCSAMLNTIPEDRTLATDQKVKMFRIAMLAAAGGEQDFSVENVAFIKDRVGKLYGPLIVGRVFDLLEQKETSNA